MPLAWPKALGGLKILDGEPFKELIPFSSCHLSYGSNHFFFIIVSWWSSFRGFCYLLFIFSVIDDLLDFSLTHFGSALLPTLSF